MGEASINRGGRPPQYPINRVYGQMYPDGENVADTIYFQKCGGLDFSTYLFNVQKNMCPFMKNWRLDRGTLVQRPGTSALGIGSGVEIIGLIGFTISSGVSFAIRVTLTEIQIFNTATQVWDSASGPTFTSSSGAHVYYTGWADKLMLQFSDENLYELDPGAGTYSLIDTTGADTPSGEHDTGKAIATFAGRILVCQADFPYRLAWSAKNDNTDWAGIGSGYEDFFSTPGGSIDELLTVIPVSDDQAIVVRSNSIWLMATTGNADVPFRFTKQYSDIACRSPYGIVGVPGAAIVPGLDDIYLVSPSEIKAIGGNIRPRYLGALFSAEKISSTFDEKRGELVMGVHEGNTDQINVIYRFSFTDNGWTRDEYKSQFHLINFMRYISSFVTIGELQGVIRDQVGSIAFLGSYSNATGVLFAGKAIGNGQLGLQGRIMDLLGTIEDLVGPIASNDGDWFVIREDPTTTTDFDQAYNDAKIETETELWTGILIGNNKPPTLLGREKVTDAQLEYLLPNVPLEVDVDWSPDGGLSWQQFSKGNIASTIGVPSVLRFTHTFEAGQPIMRLATPRLAFMRSSGFHVFITDGAMENP